MTAPSEPPPSGPPPPTVHPQPHGTTSVGTTKNSKGLLWALIALAVLVVAALVIWQLVRHGDDGAKDAVHAATSSASSAANTAGASITSGADSASSAVVAPSADTPTSTQIIPGVNGTQYVLQGAILAKYHGLDDATRTDLGAPTGDEQSNPDGGVLQQFEHGVIACKGNAYVVWGAIRDKWNELGGPEGQLGYPTSDEHDAPNGQKRSTFEHGTITGFAPAGGDTTVTPN